PAPCRRSSLAKPPVKLLVGRCEAQTCTGNRPSMITQIRAGLDDDGRIIAWDYRSWGGPGYTGSGGRTSYVGSYLERAERRGAHVDLVTATDAARPMRAPGWPQGNFAAEGMIDALARAAGIDALDFRLRND